MRQRLILLFFVLTTRIVAQDTSGFICGFPGFIPAEFPGGAEAYKKYLHDSTRYPAREKANGIHGTVQVYLEVSKTGEIQKVRVLKGVEGGAGLDSEAVRVISAMPNWKPGAEDGKPKRFSFGQPIHFVLEETTPPTISFTEPNSPDTELPVPPLRQLTDTTSVDTVPASFPGGITKQQNFISKNVRYPNIAKEAGHMGTVYIQYTIDTTGKVTNAKVFKGVDGAPELDEEALRVVKKFPKHEPARVNGKAVESVVIYPVRFVLQ